MTTLYGFELIKEKNIPELNTFARLYRHVKTGAELLSLVTEDENKCFGITFRTPPADSTGVAHIMEHSVLCGSRKYPVKEPFVELLKGSLKTFLNAFTYPDKTVYPVASPNLQDFYNLVDVYLDAVFYPLISPHTFQQEGWHYELDSPNSPLTYKGVVFNEMKGNYSSPDSLLGEWSQQILFPDNTYRLDSGGDPAKIPTLTYEQFKAFHQTYYHPSNARIYFYGDDDPETRLKLLDAYLKDFDHLAVHSEIPLQKPLNQPQHIHRTYAAAANEEGTGDKAMFTINWLLPESTDIDMSTALSILSYILLGIPASPLRKALLDAELGEDITGGGIQSYLRQLYFSVGLKGVEPEGVPTAEALITNTLADLATTGIDPELIEAAVNTLEFRLREQNTGRFPRGLSIMLGALGTWLYNSDPFDGMAFETPLARLKQSIADDPAFFQKLINQHLLNNPHRFTLLLTPDTQQQKREDAAEQQRLAQARAAMSANDRQAIITAARQLKTIQETPDSAQALATIPHLKLNDIDKLNKLTPIAVIPEQDRKILYHNLFTNGIVYLDLGFNLHTLPQNLLPYVPLFTQALLEIGTEKEDFVKLSQRIGRKTGGIWPSSLVSATQNSPEATAWFFLRSKATVAQTDDLLDILRDVLLTVKLDNPARFKQMVLENKAGHEAGLIPGGHGVVNSRLRAHFTEADWAEEEMGGLSNLFFIRRLATEVDTNWPAVLEKLEAIRHTLLNNREMVSNITLDQANWNIIQPKLSAFLRDLPDAPVIPVQWTPRPPAPFEGLTIPAQVNYVGKGANLYQVGYTFHGSISVISHLLRSTWLWDKVRVQGGAYGGFCSFDQHSGVFSYLSYRDPNLLKTLAIYDETANFLRTLALNDEELTKNIIGTISNVDAYQLPDARGYSSMMRYLLGYTDEARQQMRDEILGTTQTHLKAFAEVLDRVNKEGLVVVMGSAEAIEAANAQSNNLFTLVKVM